MTVPTLIDERPPATTSRPGLAAQLLRRKPIGQLVSEAETGHGGTRLVRSFGVLQLTMISVGATLGTGILVILGESVPLAGPAIWISFAIAGIAALLSAVSYAEMAGLVPAAGSSYSYTYATMGEGMAWICGWCLVLEYAVSVAAVAVGAGQYVNETLAVFGQVLPDAISAPPGDGGVLNAPAIVIVVLAMVLAGARCQGERLDQHRDRADQGRRSCCSSAPWPSPRSTADTSSPSCRWVPPASLPPHPGSSSPTSASMPPPRPARKRGTRSATSRGRSCSRC